MDGNDVFPSQPQNAQQAGQNTQMNTGIQSPLPAQPVQSFQPTGQTAPVQPTSLTSPVSDPFSAPPLQQVVPQPLVQQPSAQSQTVQQTPSPQGMAQSVPQQPSATVPSDTPKITLEDLYGPSQQTQNPSASIPQQTTPIQASSAIPAQPQPSQGAPLSQSMPSPQSIPESQPFVNQPLPQKEEVSSLSLQQASSSGEGMQPPAQKTGKKPSDGSDNGGFHFMPLLIKIIGGLFVVVIILLIVSFVASFFGHKSGNEKVTLTYWGLWEDSTVMQGVIADFERQNPNITINYSKEDPTNYTDRLLTRIQNGTGPDIFRFHNSWVTPLQRVLLPLPSTVIDKKQLEDNYFPTVSKDLISNGAIYGIPLEMDNLVLYTNKSIFDHAGAKVPTTWEDFVTVARGLTVKDSAGHIKTAGAALGTYNNVSHAPDILSLLLLQNGADLQKLDGSQNAIDALNFYTSFAKTDDRVWDNTLDNSLLAFSRGNLAMYFGYSYDYFAIKAASPQLDFEVHAVPHLPGRDMSIASYWVEGVSNTSKHQKEALLFLKYLTQKDVITKLYSEEAKTRQFGEIYPRKDLASSLSTDSILATFVNQAGKAASSFFVSDTNFDGFNGALNQYLGNAVNSLLSDTSADSALATLAQGVSQVFNKYASPSQ